MSELTHPSISYLHHQTFSRCQGRHRWREHFALMIFIRTNFEMKGGTYLSYIGVPTSSQIKFRNLFGKMSNDLKEHIASGCTLDTRIPKTQNLRSCKVITLIFSVNKATASARKYSTSNDGLLSKYIYRIWQIDGMNFRIGYPKTCFVQSDRRDSLETNKESK